MSASPIRLIVGLGNPGEKYTKTRHNAGFLFLDQLQQFYSATVFKSQKQVHGVLSDFAHRAITRRLLKPSTFMNLSGQAVAAALSYYQLDATQLLVVHDELDLDPGVAKLKLEGGHGGNNGLRDIIKHLGHGNFARLRIGIGHPGSGRDVSS